jgi:hypothetical protein
MQIRPIRYYLAGKRMLDNPLAAESWEKHQLEIAKPIQRYEVINFLLSKIPDPTRYLEIGVRNPVSNFSLIKCEEKYSVDPGVEFKENPVDFPYTSDVFFKKLDDGSILTPEIRFDVIFIDGLHLAGQVDKDISNSLRYLKETGYIVLHDCNPPTEWYARESYQYLGTPAGSYWNGTTWKAFLKWRFNQNVFSCCVDTDWGLGVISKSTPIGQAIPPENEFYEFDIFDKKRAYYLNLLSFEAFVDLLDRSSSV